MANLANVSKTKALQMAASAKRQLARVREEAAEMTGRVMDTGLTVGGGAAAGYVNAKFPGQWVGVDKEIWIGGGLALIGLAGMGGAKWNQAVLDLGNGMLAGWAYNAVRTKTLEG